ncbi:hypothetical protein SUGI_0703380 [Cryptomeria japonica]|nr:hypothetical protein SUGI_0703380 [Cryptomeria japonica]
MRPSDAFNLQDDNDAAGIASILSLVGFGEAQVEECLEQCVKQMKELEAQQTEEPTESTCSPSHINQTQYENGIHEDFSLPSEIELPNWIKEGAKNLGIQIDMENEEVSLSMPSTPMLSSEVIHYYADTMDWENSNLETNEVAEDEQDGDNQGSLKTTATFEIEDESEETLCSQGSLNFFLKLPIQRVDAAIAEKTMTRSPMEEPNAAVVEKKITRRHVEELEPFPGFMALTAFANAFHSLQPLRVPGWSFAWLELICHRSFMSKLLLSNNQKGWPFFQRLLVDLFKFMEPYLRNAELSYPVRLLYKGTLRVLLVLLHDFSEILCDYHFSFCDVIPPSCIQMWNLILSAFPRNMRLPDPFTLNMKVDLLPEISQSPRILSEVDAALKSRQMKTEVDEYLKTRQPMSMLIVDMKNRVLLPQHEAACARERELTDAADHEYYGCTALYTSNYCKVH